MRIISYTFQDLKKQKVKTIFAIGGVLVSIFLLTVVGCLSDSLSFSYLDQATNESGSADITIAKITAQDLNYNPYFDENIIQEHLVGKIEDIEYFYPRLNSLFSVEKYDEVLKLEIRRQIIGYGINTTLEQNSGEMGNLWICQNTLEYERTDELFKGPIREGYVILTRGAANLYHAFEGDEILVGYGSDEYTFIVQAVVEQEHRFSRLESTVVIFELTVAQQIMNLEGKVNSVHATLKDPEKYYDTRNIAGSLGKIREIAEIMQNEIGFDYLISLPKMDQVQNIEQQSTMMTMTFYFITFFSMLITGILINSILSTSVEERIREFGIMQVVGGRKSFSFKLVFISGIFIAISGTFLGTFLGAVIAPPTLNWIFDYFDIWIIPMDFIILPQTIVRSLLIGVIITSIISIFPAYRASNLIIANAIDPSRKNDTGEKYHLKKEGSVNLRLMGIGFGIALAGIFIFLVVPRILSGSGGPNLTNYVFVVVLLLILIGLVLATMGFVPVLERLVGLIFKPFIRRFYPIYRINLIRYRRRNNGSILMFALTFAFIFFISSVLEMNSANNAVFFEFEYGADMVMSNTGSLEAENSITMELLDELRELPGIQGAAPIISNSPIDFVKLTSILFSMGAEGFDDTLNFEELFGGIQKYTSYAGDMGDFRNYYCNLVGIDENYYETIDRDMLMWEPGSSGDSIQELVESSQKCILAKSLADGLGISTLPAQIKITMRDPDKDGDYGNITVYEVIGISKGMPGIFNFRSSEANLNTAPGIMVNFEDYCELLEWGDPTSPDLILDKILINVVDNEYDSLRDTLNYVDNYFSNDYEFILDESQSLIDFMASANDTSSIIMQTILFFSILVSLFGLISSMYSTIIERLFEIGILRAMGMKPFEVRAMLMAEAVTIMISSGSLGAIIGWFIAYLMQTNVSILTELPVVTAVNVGTLVSTFLISIGISIVGMFVITQKIHKMKIMEVLRQSF
ncbi:MAG: ABC transporter permease [Promethearchaeota archaeon]